MDHADEIRAHLLRIGSSSTFVRAGRIVPLLKYLVDSELEGTGARLSQYRIATDVLGRGEQFDPSTDSIVRVEIGRLRNKLREYYESNESEDGVRFELPKGGCRVEVVIDTAAMKIPRNWTLPNLHIPLLGVLAAIVLLGGIWLLKAIEQITDTQDDLADRLAVVTDSLNAAVPSEFSADVPEQLTTSPEIYNLYSNLSDYPSAQRIERLNRALELDPEFAEARMMRDYLLAHAPINTAFGLAFEPAGVDIDRHFEQIARTTLALDHDNVLTHIALGIHYMNSWQWTDARQVFEAVVDTTPDHGRLLNYAYLLAFSGNHDEAIELMDRLVADAPHKSALFSIRGLALGLAGDLDAAASSLRRGVSAPEAYEQAYAPSMLIERSWLAAVEIARGNADAALRELQFMDGLSAETRIAELPFMTYAYSMIGRREDARRVLAELEPAMTADGPFGAGAWALVYLAKGDSSRARDWLEKAAGKAARQEPDEHFFALMLLRANLLADPRLEQPEFATQLSRIAGH